MMLLDKITLKVFSPSLYLYFLAHTDAPLCNPHDVACLLRSASRKMSSFPRVLCVSGYLSITLHSSKPNMKFKAGTTSLPGSPTHSICVWVGLPPIMATGFPGYISKMREPGRSCIGLLTPPVRLTVKPRLVLNPWSSCLNFLSAGRHHAQPLSYSHW